ncbi:MAG: hypothetical protein ACREPM_01515 [Gemmatimonadaceae bacterium]
MTTRAPIPAPSPADVHALAHRFRLPIADLTKISAHAVELVPERWARRFHVVPVDATEQELLIATADPLDVDCERTLGFATGRHIRLALADAHAIEECIDDAYGGDATTKTPESIVEVQHLDNGNESAPPTHGEDGGSSTVTLLVDELLASGIAGRASDIHIEPE